MDTSDLSPFRVGCYWTYDDHPYVITRMLYSEEAAFRVVRDLAPPHAVIEERFIREPGQVDIVLEPSYGRLAPNVMMRNLMDLTGGSWWYSILTHQRWGLHHWELDTLANSPTPHGGPNHIRISLIRCIS